jgi:hypothetical protein
MNMRRRILSRNGGLYWLITLVVVVLALRYLGTLTRTDPGPGLPASEEEVGALPVEPSGAAA